MPMPMGDYLQIMMNSCGVYNTKAGKLPDALLHLKCLEGSKLCLLLDQSRLCFLSCVLRLIWDVLTGQSYKTSTYTYQVFIFFIFYEKGIVCHYSFLIFYLVTFPTLLVFQYCLAKNVNKMPWTIFQTRLVLGIFCLSLYYLTLVLILPYHTNNYFPLKSTLAGPFSDKNCFRYHQSSIKRIL